MRVLETKKTLYRASDFVSWQRAGNLNLSPSFQRRPVWKQGAKSFLIDTIVRGLPMPIIFLREQRSNLASLEPMREVVDGQQRIRTLFSYLDPALLPNYSEATDKFCVKKNHNPELANKTFSDLPKAVKQRILDYEFSVHVLPADVDDREVLQIFARMNATGVKLNDQELRNAEFFGEFKTSIYELASEQLPRWRKWQVFTEYNIARMEEVELTSEFAFLALRGLTGKTQSALNRLYDEKDEKFIERSEFERRFRAVMDCIDDSLGADMALLPFRRKTLFYSLFAFAYHRLFVLGSALKHKRQGTLSRSAVYWVKQAGDNIEKQKAPDDVLDATARRTTHPSSRRRVFEYLHKGR